MLEEVCTKVVGSVESKRNVVTVAEAVQRHSGTEIMKMRVHFIEFEKEYVLLRMWRAKGEL